MAEDILDKGGLLLSEYCVWQKPLSNYFVERNRIQAGLSQAVMILETDLKGGTMHTAKFCMEYGRRLACLDHPAEYRDHSKTRGNQLLIREGKAMAVVEKAEVNALSNLLWDEFNAGKRMDKVESLRLGKTFRRTR